MKITTEIKVQMEAELEGICFELIRADLFRITDVHMDTSNAMVVDIIYNLDEHLRTHFASELLLTYFMCLEMFAQRLERYLNVKIQKFTGEHIRPY